MLNTEKLWDCIKSIIKVIPNGGQAISFLEAVQNIEAMNLEAQASALYHVFQRKGMENDAVVSLLEKRIKNSGQPISYYVTYILLQLINNTETKQTEIETKAFCDFLEKKIEWDEFCMYCSVIRGMILMDFESLRKIKESNGKIVIDADQLSDQQKVEYGRLEGMGLLTNVFNPKSNIWMEMDEGGRIPMIGKADEEDNRYELTIVGRKIGEYLD